MNRSITEGELQKLFTKPYGGDPPSKEVWASYYEDDVLFIDPTQEKYGKAIIKTLLLMPSCNFWEVV